MALAVLRMLDLDLRDKRVLIREDLNAPIKDGRVTSDARLKAVLPTLRAALKMRARVMVMSHLGRPKEGAHDAALSLAPVAAKLSELLGQDVPLIAEWLDGVDVGAGQLVLCENVRFNVGEKANDAKLAKRMAALCDVFVMDAFGTAHRAEASTAGVAELARIACAGPLLVAELDALAAALEEPKRPLVAIVGGAKVSSKLEVLQSLAAKVDELILGGGIANTVLAAAGLPVGRSLMEKDMLGFARELVAGKFGRAAIPLPTDVVVAANLETGARGRIKAAREVEPTT
jgi:phosphoglycerate kinase